MPKQRVIVFWLLFGMHYSIFDWPNNRCYDRGYEQIIQDERCNEWNDKSLLFRREIDKELDNER